jgi:hypothetical protein
MDGNYNGWLLKSEDRVDLGGKPELLYFNWIIFLIQIPFIFL